MKMNRKVFIKKAAGAMLIAIPAYSLVGCSSSDDSSDDPDPDPGSDANCLANGTAVSIGSNHGHSLTVSKEDVNAGAEKTYSIQGTSTHNHSVTLTSANFDSLKTNASISATSTNDGHSHSVTVSCA
jgi:hypothetical protein